MAIAAFILSILALLSASASVYWLYRRTEKWNESCVRGVVEMEEALGARILTLEELPARVVKIEKRAPAEVKHKRRPVFWAETKAKLEAGEAQPDNQ